ncbi:MAG: hypothetical protein LQ338_005053 [Usnochroma carphineum]|nr:MAG: hypothetical protein LQ338_005053 [Usnochroma carphineum]
MLSTRKGSSSTTIIAIPTNPPRTPGLNVGTKTAIGISIPLTIIGLCTLLALGILRHRKNKHERQSNQEAAAASSPEDDDQPYLQRKAELEAEEQAKFELDAEQRQHELEGDNEIREMAATANGGAAMSHQRYELNGEERCKELEAKEQSKELE